MSTYVTDEDKMSTYVTDEYKMSTYVTAAKILDQIISSLGTRNLQQRWSLQLGRGQAYCETTPSIQKKCYSFNVTILGHCSPV